MRIYVDNTAAYTVNAGQLDTSLMIAAGTHTISVVAWDINGASFKSSVSVNVGDANGGGGIASGPCPLDAASPSVTVCAPSEGSTVTSPFRVAAGTRSVNPVTAMTVYVDTAAVYTVNAAQFDTTITAPAGAHKLTIRAWDNKGNYFSRQVNVNVAGTGGGGGTSDGGGTVPCPMDPTNPSVTVCSPTAGSTVSSPVRFVAGTTSSNTVTAMRVYVDTVAVYTVNAARMDTSLALSNGVHNVTIVAWDKNGLSFKKSQTITVGTSGGDSGGAPPCTLNAASPSVTICTPGNNATVGAPVHIVAGTTSSNTVTAMRIYVDTVTAYNVAGNKLDTNLPMAAGNHTITVVAWDKYGTSFKSSVSIKVDDSDSGGAPPCELDSDTFSVTICSPLANSINGDVLDVWAGTTDPNPVTLMEVYLDEAKVAQANTDHISAQVPATRGIHLLAVRATDNAGVVFSKQYYVQVAQNDPQPCPPGTADPSITFCNPIDGQTVSNPVRVLVGTNSSSPVYTLKAYLDGTLFYSTHRNQLDQQISPADGTHTVRIDGVNEAGNNFTSSIQITVGSGAPPCPLSSTNNTVTICEPAANATVTSPLHIVAGTTSTSKVTSMAVYVDNTLVYKAAVTTLDTNVTMGAGTHSVTVQAWNQAGDVFKKALTLTVNPTASTEAVAPRNAVLTPGQTRQFTGPAGASWLVDGIAGGTSETGTISSSGLYTAGSVGEHVITADVNAKTYDAHVYVNNVAGVYTYHMDNARTGNYRNEIALKKSNVNAQTFGKVGSQNLDGIVVAQPLYAANVNVAGLGIRNVLYVATEGDSVYALNADDISAAPLWKKTFTNPAAGVTTVPGGDVQGNNFGPQLGITGTPVIDPLTKTLFVVAETKENGAYVHRLHALDIASGAERSGSPKVIDGVVNGTGFGHDDAFKINFNELVQFQRPALTLNQGVVYIAYASHGDYQPYHGWIFAFDAASMQLIGYRNVTPNGQGGGIWQSGGAFAVDAAGNMFVALGNGTMNLHNGGSDVGNAVVKMNGLDITDYFAPFNYNYLNSVDLDVGSGAPLLLPDDFSGGPQRLMVLGTKEGRIYLLNRDDLGKFHANDDSQIVESVGPILGRVYSSPAYWNGNLYFGSSEHPLMAFKFNNGLIGTTPSSKTAMVSDSRGVVPVVSSNGDAEGIVWLIERSANGSAILRAYDGDDLTNELYNTTQSGTRDLMNAAVRFQAPVIVNGRVYAATQGRVTAYSLLP